MYNNHLTIHNNNNNSNNNNVATQDNHQTQGNNLNNNGLRLLYVFTYDVCAKRAFISKFSVTIRIVELFFAGKKSRKSYILKNSGITKG